MSATVILPCPKLGDVPATMPPVPHDERRQRGTGARKAPTVRPWETVHSLWTVLWTIRPEVKHHPMEDEATSVWEAVARGVTHQVSSVVWRTTFSEVRAVDYDGATLTIVAPSLVLRDRIDNRFRPLLMGVISDLGLEGVDLAVEVDPDSNLAEPLNSELSPLTTTSSSGASTGGVSVPTTSSDQALSGLHGSGAPNSVRSGGLNIRYTFASFVTGPSNRFAQAAALSVAETPARSYNPLFVYGSAGLGKTHLLQAIAHYVSENYPTYRVRYLSTEELLNEFVDAIRNNAQPDFKRRYRENDVLLVDDIQFMEGKEQLQEEFFHTFNTLYEANRQIVLSSDRPPDSIATLEDRLRSRFKMGLITDIQPPDFETRLAIVRKKSEQSEFPLPGEVLEFIVTNITNNIRELEGALNRVTAYANLTRTPVTMDSARQVLGDLSAGGGRIVTPERILEATSEFYGFSIDELKSKSRRRPLVTARQVGMYLFRELTELSYPQIAKIYGGRDHTTVIHAYEKIKALMAERPQIYQDVQTLIQQIKNGL